MTAGILPRIARGDQSAVRECVDTYGARVWSIAQRFTSSRADAEDAVQDVFVAIWQSASRFDSRQAEEATFVTMIARRRLIDRLRREPDAEFTDSLDELVGADASTAEHSAEVQAVSTALNGFDSPQREVILLSVYGGFSHGAIAERLELPLGTVKTQLRRGLQKIRQQLGIVQSGQASV